MYFSRWWAIVVRLYGIIQTLQNQPVRRGSSAAEEAHLDFITVVTIMINQLTTVINFST